MAGERKLENAAFVLPVFGAVLIVPPALSVFNIEARLFGVPLLVLYLFAVWAGLIAVSAWLSCRLPAQEEEPASGLAGGDDGGGP